MLDPVDKVIPKSKIRKRLVSRGLSFLLVLIIIIFSLGSINRIFKPSLERRSLELAIVERGEVYEISNATGVLKLKTTQTLLSPVNTSIKKVKRLVGEQVKAGDTLLILDDTKLLEELNRTELEDKVLHNKLQKMRVTHSIEKTQNQSKLQILSKEVSDLTQDRKEHQQLLDVGGISKAEMQEIENQFFIKNNELNNLKQLIGLQNKMNEVLEKELFLDLEIMSNTKYELKKKLASLYIISPFDGIVTSINNTLGSSVSKDSELVKVSKLNAFKVEAWVKDTYSDQVAAGMEVRIYLERAVEVKGVISNIRPVTEKGNIYFDVYPETENHPQFLPNKSVGINILTDYQNDKLRLKEGPFYKGEKILDVFKLHGNKALKTEITVGRVNNNYIEIEKGISLGDTILIQNTSEFNNNDVITIENN